MERGGGGGSQSPSIEINGSIRMRSYCIINDALILGQSIGVDIVLSSFLLPVCTIVVGQHFSRNAVNSVKPMLLALLLAF